MKRLRLLWVDDQWSDDPASTNPQHQELVRWENDLTRELAGSDIHLSVTRRPSGRVTDDIVDENYSALVLDYLLLKDPDHPESNALKLLERWKRKGLRLPPVAIFSGYRLNELRSYLRGSSSGVTWSVFAKSDSGALDLARFLKNTVLRGPVTLAVISDLHAGFIEEAGGIQPDDFVHSLANSISEVAREESLDALIFPGDLAWRNQGNDLTRAFLTMKQLRFAAGLERPEQIIFCPGNHDLDLQKGADPWQHFGTFVDLLATGSEPHFSQRFVLAWSDVTRHRRPFQSQDTLLSIVDDTQRGVLYACLNSCVPTGNGYEVKAGIDDIQWSALQNAVEHARPHTLRVAVLHHPIFSAPGGLYRDDPSLADQGKAMQLLSKLGFGLVLHGHTHFSGAHSHRIRILNGSPGGKSLSKILTVACPSVSATPNTVCPYRQYFVIRLGAYEESTSSRSVSLSTLVFNPADRTWSKGEEMPAGEFDIDSMG